MILEGQCYLTFDVKITYDQSESLRFIREKQEAEMAGESFEFESVEYKKDTFQIKFRLIQFTILTEASIEKYKIDFMQWLKD